MNALKTILLAGGATVILAVAAQAADLPTTKPAPAAPPTVNCNADFMTWLNSTAGNCPLGANGIAIYGAFDVGFGYESHAAPFNAYYPQGIGEVVSKQSGAGAWQGVPNGLSQSNIGLRVSVPLIADVKFIADMNAGFDPYSLEFSNGPGSLVSQNGIPGPYQQANGDSSRAGQWDDTRGYLGLSSATYGTLKVGRQYAFSNDLINAYDPTGGSYAFSLFGNSSTLGGGLGLTELARYNTSVQYVYDYQGLFHVGGMTQIAGYDEGNGAKEAYQFNIGGAFSGFTIDGVYSHADDAIALSTFAPALPANWNPTDLKGTYANLDAFQVLAKYTYQQFTLSGGYQTTRFANPDSGDAAWDIANPVTAQGDGYVVQPNSVVAGSVSTTAYTISKNLQSAWIGAKYSVLPNLDLEGGYWHVWQNDYDNKGTTAAPVLTPMGTGNCASAQGSAKPNVSGTGGKTGYAAVPNVGTINGDCAGHEDAFSFVIDYRPFKRVDTYAGVMFTKVNAGMASGYAQDNNAAFTAGVKLSF